MEEGNQECHKTPLNSYRLTSPLHLVISSVSPHASAFLLFNPSLVWASEALLSLAFCTTLNCSFVLLGFFKRIKGHVNRVNFLYNYLNSYLFTNVNYIIIFLLFGLHYKSALLNQLQFLPV